MFELRSENLTQLGGMMGAEKTSTNWRRYFSLIEEAKLAAEKDHRSKIDWIKVGQNWRSPDLRYVMYHIQEIKPEARQGTANPYRPSLPDQTTKTTTRAPQEICAPNQEDDGIDLTGFGVALAEAAVDLMTDSTPDAPSTDAFESGGGEFGGAGGGSDW